MFSAKNEAARRGVRHVIVFVLTVVFLCVFPVILLLLCPIYLIRFVVGKLHLIVYSGEGKILSTKSAVFASDDIYGKPRCPLLVLMLFKGKMSLEDLYKEVQAEMVDKKLTGTEDLAYPELQQRIKSWLGFYFWRWDRSFRVDNHVKLYAGQFKDQTCNEETLPMIVNELTVQAFIKGQSPWEVVLIPNVNIQSTQEILKGEEISAFPEGKREQTVCIFRLHHSLADGISIRKLLLDCAGYQDEHRSGKGSRGRNTSCSDVLKVLTFPIRAPFETIGALWDCNDTNEWHLPESKLSGELRSAASVPITVDFIKGIKNSYEGVTFAGVVLAAMSGGIHNFMAKRGIQIPELMHCLTPLPMPGHSEKLRNHLTAAAIALPLGSPTAEERLRRVSQHLKNLKSSVVPQTNYWFYPVIGGLFPSMASKLFRHSFTTALLSSFQGPSSRIKFMGHDIEDIIFAGGLLMGNIGLGMTLLSYNGAFRIVVGVDSAILASYKDAQELVQLIHEEFFVLQDLNYV